MADLREIIDRRVFEEIWPDANLLMRAVLCAFYRPCYPHWTEFQPRGLVGHG